MRRWVVFCVILLAVVGCAKKVTSAPEAANSVDGIANVESQLAYEHSVTFELPLPLVPVRMGELRKACTDHAHGRCSLIEYEASSSAYRAGRMVVRLAPEAVEPLVTRAGQGGKSTERSTRAEDLSVAVADNARARDRMEAQARRLDALAERNDLSVADHLQLARELATLEAERAAAERLAAQHALRLETNLLTLEFRAIEPPPSRWANLGEALGASFDQFLDGTAEAIEATAYALPYLLLLFPLALLWRWLWRWATGARRR